jgi:hypothetical protein
LNVNVAPFKFIYNWKTLANVGKTHFAQFPKALSIRCGLFSNKWKMTIKKVYSAIGELITNLFIASLPIKEKEDIGPMAL